MDVVGPDIELNGPDGLLARLQKAVLERALDAELTEHLGYERGDAAGNGSGNSRNGTTPKALHSETGSIDLEVPRDRVFILQQGRGSPSPNASVDNAGSWDAPWPGYSAPAALPGAMTAPSQPSP